MHSVAVIFLALSISLVMCYDEKYDNVDVDKILSDDTMLDSYIDCMLDKGDCSMEHAKEFRKILPEVITTACGTCSPLQRAHVRKSVKKIQEKRPEKFEEIQNKFDPKREHLDSFTKFMLGSD